MTDETRSLRSGDPSLDDILAEYLAAEEAGTPPDRNEFLGRHSQYAKDLHEFFANRDQMQRLASPLRASGDGSNGRSNGLLGKLRYFGDYELLEEIAAGGMGVVYKARQVSLNRLVAVKMILRGSLASEDDIKRFRAEAEAAANLQHPGIVPIHEVGLHDGQHYFSMDLVEGRNLAELLREQPLSPKQATAYVTAAAEAVHYAHQQGTLHRDLKPSNLLIDKQDRVRVTDFGLAKRISDTSDLTLSGQILGTPAYMPPEQAAGKRSLIAAPSDVYSLGAILYECLAGRPPFRGETPSATLRQVETLDPVSPRLLNPGVPRDLETICLKCLEKEPHKRYGTAELLVEDLRRFERGEPIHARPIRTWQRVAKWVRRHPTAASLVMTSAVALLALVGVVVGQYYNNRLKTLNAQLATAKGSLEDRNQQLSASNINLEEARERLESSNKELANASGKLRVALGDVKAEQSRARRYLYAARMALVQRADQEKQTGRVVQLLRSVIPETSEQEDLRDIEWHLLWRKHQGEELRLRGHTAPVTAVAFSPDGQWIASGSADQTIKIWNAHSAEERHTLRGHTDRVRGIAFSLDGGQLVSVAGDKTVKIWDCQGGEEIRRLDEEAIAAQSEFWGPFGGELNVLSAPQGAGGGTATFSKAFNADKSRRVEGKTTYMRYEAVGTVTLWRNDASISPIRSFEDIPAVVTQVALSPDGSAVAAAALDQTIRIWDATTGTLLYTLHASDGVRSVAFSPDGSRIVAGTEDRLVMLWTLPGKERRTIHQGSKLSPANCVSFGANGRLLGTVYDGKTLVWDTVSGKQVASLSGHRYLRPSLSPTSNWIAGPVQDQLIDVPTGRTKTKLHGNQGPGGSYGYAISRDETLVAEARADTSRMGTIWVHDTVTGKLVRSFAMRRWASSVAISPDNRLIAAGTGYFAQGSEDRGSLQVREIKTGNVTFAMEKLPIDIWGLAFSPDGKLLAAAMGVFEDGGGNLGRIRIWSTSTWETLYDLRGHTGCVWSLDFSPSGRRLASAGGQRYRRVAGKNVSAPGEFKLWDVSTGEEVLSVVTEKGPVNGIAFSPNGHHLATASEDGLVQVWDGTPLAKSPTFETLPDE